MTTKTDADDTLEGIAIIGMSGRFPGAENVNAFWQNLLEGVCSISTFSDAECRASGVPEALISNSGYVKRGAVLKGVDLFDATFFGYSAREASIIDPQQRLFLECAWEALENAGYDPFAFKGDIGVYAGSGINNYLMKNLLSTSPNMESVINPITFIGNDKDFLTTRVSYKLNLKGPSINVQTACSTSLVALQLACQGLLTFQCDMALSGAVSLQTPRMKGYMYTDGQILSSDGHCRAFDKDATGTVFGEGVGAVVLKRLEDAVADRDTIHAVIRSVAINNDGSEKVGFMAPGVAGQAKVIAMALALAEVQPDEIGYIETHGTGTPMGDPIEIAALTQVFRRQTDRKGFCPIGSVKTNIGHLDVAAGMAGLIKTAMAIRNGKIPESLFFNQANPELKLDQSPFYVNTVTSAWSSKGKPRIAGISSFGVGGTNAHAILAQAPSTDFRPSLRPCSLLVLSARTETVLDLTTKNLGRHFAEHPDISLADTAYTLQLGRKHFEHRRILVCSDVGTVVNTFHSPDFKQSYTGKVPPLNQDVVFMFTGQGSQYVNMAKEIYHHIPVVNKEINRCAEILRPILNQDIRDIWFSPSSASETAQTSLDETLYTQTVLFTLEYALAKFWMSVGITPAAMIGHSIGEYVAACLAGVFSLETALKIVFIRGREMQRQPAGAMLAVQISESDIKPLLTDGLTLAAVNSPAQCVLSGPVPEIDRLHAALKAGHGPNGQQVFCSRLHTSHAYHSAMMAPAAQALVDTLKTIDLQPPTIPFISNLTGLTITPEQAMDPEYWGLHLTQTVRFSKGIQTLLESPDRTFLEIGPGRTLTAFAQVHFESPNALPALSSIPHPKQQASDYAFLLTTLGRLWINGCRIDWTGYWGEEPRMRIPLPTYPFERQRHWIDAAEKFTAQSKRSTFLGSILERFSFYLPLKQRSGRTKSGSAPFDPGRINDPSFDAVETELARLWQKVLGVKQVSGEDDFFESGGHSLLAAQLFAEIETTFGKNIPISTLYHSSTFSKLAAMLKDRDMNTEWTSLVPIRPGGIKLPLYLVHGAEGNVLLYRALVLHLDAERPVYGMQSAGLDGTKGFDPDFKKVAGNYIKEIKTVQPEGPYLMGGYCLGGVIALEMAQQLIAMGDTVIFLGMIEIYNIQTLNWPLPLYLRLYNSSLNVWYHLLNMISSRNEAKLDFFKEKVQTEYRRLRVWLRMRLARLLSLTGIRTQAIYHHQRVDKAYDKALEAYFPVKYPGVITVFGAKKLPAGFTDPDTYGFGGIAEKGVDIHILPVYPRGTLVEPYVKILAEKLDMAMAGAEKTIYNGQTRA